MGQSPAAISLAIILLVAFSIITFVGGNRRVLACSCADPVPIGVSIDHAAGIFAGKVTALGRTYEPYPIEIATFDVDTVWKGNLGHSVLVSTAQDGSTCGYGFQLGETYLVYAVGESANLYTSSCMRTKPLAAAEPDLAALGWGTSPVSISRGLVETDVDITLMSIASMVVAAGVGGFMFLRMRSRY